jgi:hypothetical protein
MRPRLWLAATVALLASAFCAPVKRVGELIPHATLLAAAKHRVQAAHLVSLAAAATAEEEEEEEDKAEGTVSMAWTRAPIHVLASEESVQVSYSGAPNASTASPQLAARAVKGAAAVQCLSHDLFNTLSQVMRLADDAKKHANGALSQSEAGDKTAKIVTLCIGLVLSVGLLFFGQQLATTAIAILLFIVTFMLTFGILDQIMYQPSAEPTFHMCVMPWVASVIVGLLAAVVILCCASQLAAMTLFVMGFALGAVGMYMGRSFILATMPALASPTQGGFGWYWIVLVVVSLITGLIATWLKKGVFSASTIALGAYGLATCILGLVMTATGRPAGYKPGEANVAHYGPFLGIFITAVVIGIGAHCYFHHEAEKKKAEEKKKKGGTPPKGKGGTPPKSAA